LTTSTVCLLAKNEERAIVEWLAFQRVIGFDRIIVYDNGSTDATATLVQAVASREAGVLYVSWPDMPGRRPQPSAYADAVRRCETEWIAFFDTDEFLVLNGHETVNGFLSEFATDVAAIAVNWLIFGSGGLTEATGELVIDRFVRCAHGTKQQTRFCKSLIRRQCIETMAVHSAALKCGRYVDSAGNPITIENACKTPHVCLDGAQLNHYLLKSREEFLLKKARGHASRSPEERDKFTHIDEAFWKRNDLNDGEDRKIMRWRPALVARMADWGIAAPAIIPVRDLHGLIDEARQLTAEGAQEAAGLWQDILGQRPNDPGCWREAALALAKLDRVAEAEACLASAIGRFPDNTDLLYEYARLAGLQNRIDQEIDRWALFRQKFASNVVGYLSGSRAMRKAGRPAEAETIVQAGLSRLGMQRRLLIEHAICSEVRQSWAETIERWKLVEQNGGLDAAGTAKLGVALIRQGRWRDADILIKAGVEKYPDDIEIRIALAEVATAAERLEEAFGFWKVLLEQNPGNQRLVDGFGQARWRYELHVANVGETGGAAGPVDVGLVKDDAVRALMLGFESLGQNCEFGLVQRHFGAEPLSLLRWTTTKPDVLVRGLERRFAEFGESVELDLHKPEIMVNERSLNIRFHTFMQQNPGLDLEKFRVRQIRHLKYMAELFLERLAAGDRIYVYKIDEGCPSAQYEAIYEALNVYGPSTLVVVNRSDGDHPAGSAQRLHDRLYMGFVGRFGLDGSTFWNIAFDDWVRMCRAVVALVGEAVLF
jgi:tetratricopeptide (TPR) repeat protein